MLSPKLKLLSYHSRGISLVLPVERLLMIISSAAATSSDPPGLGLSPQKRRVALIAVTGLFFMWGFITCLNDILIPHLKGVFDLNYVQALLIQFTFFGAYFLMSLPAGKLLALTGYQRSMIIGLLTTGVGTLLFLPAAGMLSYPLFLGALFILATGITILQVAANPYISALGRPETASSRLNLAQAFNSLGTTIAPWLGGWLIFSHVTTTEAVTQASRMTDAASVKIPYLILTGMLVVLAIVLTLIHLPTIAAVESEGGREGTLWDAIRIPHISLGAAAIFVYVGAEVSIGSLLINYLGDPQVAGLTKQDAAFYVSCYWGGAMAGRFIGSGLLQFIRPNRLLAFNALAAALLATLALTTNGFVAMWAALLIGFFNSIMFPTIFTLGIAGTGHLTGRASSLLIMAIVGGAIIPLLMGRMADLFGIHHSFFVPAICYLYIVYYGLSGYRTTRTTP
jgi:FHS family L-fucose permease-like MFS transporter